MVTLHTAGRVKSCAEYPYDTRHTRSRFRSTSPRHASGAPAPHASRARGATATRNPPACGLARSSVVSASGRARRDSLLARARRLKHAWLATELIEHIVDWAVGLHASARRRACRGDDRAGGAAVTDGAGRATQPTRPCRGRSGCGHKRSGGQLAGPGFATKARDSLHAIAAETFRTSA